MGVFRLRPASRIFWYALGLVLYAGLHAGAQTQQDTFDAPAHLAFVDGTATLDRENQSQPATGGMPLVAGDRVRTTTGRVEILFPDGSALDADEYSTVELLSPTLIRLTSGRILLYVAGSSDPAGAVRYQVDTPIASAFTDGPGEYRVSLFSGVAGPEAELAVLRGYAAFSTDRGSVAIGAGERSLARENQSPGYAERFNSARFDAFDRWAAARRDERTGSVSAQYLPSELRMYGGALDRHGSWSYEPSYGYVWYPVVAHGWRPYYHGYWAPIRPYGWTWIGLDIWGWPTHHYGRWGYARSRWFWIPQRHWAPAWVHWAGAPGYVSWCPLGFDNRPVFGFALSVGHTWTGWTVLPRTHFGSHLWVVNRHSVHPGRIGRNTPFVVQASAPVETPSRAIPRVEGAAGRAIERSAAGAAVSAQPSAGGRARAVRRQAPGTSVAGAASSASRRAASPRAATATSSAGARQAPFPSARAAVAARRSGGSAGSSLSTITGAARARAAAGRSDRSAGAAARDPVGSRSRTQPGGPARALPPARTATPSGGAVRQAAPRARPSSSAPPAPQGSVVAPPMRATPNTPRARQASPGRVQAPSAAGSVPAGTAAGRAAPRATNRSSGGSIMNAPRAARPQVIRPQAAPAPPQVRTAPQRRTAPPAGQGRTAPQVRTAPPAAVRAPSAAAPRRGPAASAPAGRAPSAGAPARAPSAAPRAAPRASAPSGGGAPAQRSAPSGGGGRQAPGRARSR